MKKSFTNSELIVIEYLSRNGEDPVSKTINLKTRKELNMSLPVSVDTTTENLVKRVAEYMMNEKENREISKEWLKILARTLNIFLNENGLKVDENLAKAIASGKANEIYPQAKGTEKVTEMFNAWRGGVSLETPNFTEVLKEKAEKVAIILARAIDGKFGKMVLKPRVRIYWRFFTYGLLVLTFVKFILIPFSQWWEKVVNLLNALAWG